MRGLRAPIASVSDMLTQCLPPLGAPLGGVEDIVEREQASRGEYLRNGVNLRMLSESEVTMTLRSKSP